MKAMILAAGRGKRMRPLTDVLPKPLVEVKGKPLIFYHLEKLAASGIRECVINLAHLGDMIKQAVGDGSNFDLKIEYSQEPSDGGLETGGGIYQALSKLGNAPFVVINADIYTDYNFANLALPDGMLAHLILIPNPAHNSKGDFSLSHNLLTVADGLQPYTFAGIALYRPQFFVNCQAGKFSVTPLLKQFAQQKLVSGEVYNGMWHDVGTTERLASLNIPSPA